MNEFAGSIKEKLDTLLTEMHEYSWLFVNNPEKDFTRRRKLDFKEILNILLSMGGNSLKLELMKYFSYDVETATCSAFVQQR
ncbi:MAG: IS4/IS5 family transposase, partial [Bacillota bacterium]|nr:IS4/IS5 family transposase [Bacillota bacterium]